MSYDLMVFDLDKAPKDHASFMRWYDQQTEWSEDHSYEDPAVSSPALQNWYQEIIKEFPPLNGPFASDDADNPRTTDHCVGRDVIYSAFAWSCSDDAYSLMKALAQKHNVGFFDASGPDAEIILPDGTSLKQSGRWETSNGAASQVYYPTWTKILGVFGLPALTVAGLYLASMPIWDADLTGAQLYFIPLLGLAVLYQCYVGFHCLPHLNTVISILDDGIDVQRKQQTTRHLWPELKVATFPFASTIRIFTNDGSTVAYFSDTLANLDVLVHMINGDRP